MPACAYVIIYDVPRAQPTLVMYTTKGLERRISLRLSFSRGVVLAVEVKPVPVHAERPAVMSSPCVMLTLASINLFFLIYRDGG